MERVRGKPVYALLAAAVLVTIVIPIGFAGAASDRQPTASAGVKKQIKSLKRQVSQLQQQLEDVSKRPGPQGAQGPEGPVTGPAGGDLTGTFPNPLIGTGAVGPEELADDSVSSVKIQNNAVDTAEIKDQGVREPDIAPGSVGAGALQADSVGSFQLRDAVAVVGSAVPVNAGTPGDAQVTCPPGGMLIAGGFAWQNDEPNSIIHSAPSEADPNRTWIVRGMVNAGSNSLFAWATCLF